MNNINKKKVLKAFDIISNEESFDNTLGNAIALLVHVFDAGERLKPDKKKRIELVAGLDWITPKYRLILEEI